MRKPTKQLEAYAEVISQLDYYEKSGKFKWKKRGCGRRTDRAAGCLMQTGYISISYKGVAFLAHRIAWIMSTGELPDVIDHKNGKRDDNRIANLRSCTLSENQAFRKTDVQRKELARKKKERIANGKPKSHAAMIRERRDDNRRYEAAMLAQDRRKRLAIKAEEERLQKVIDDLCNR
jgi:hypothetical protein